MLVGLAFRNGGEQVRQVLRALPTVADMQRCIKRKRGEGQEEKEDPHAGGTTMASSTPPALPFEDKEARQRRAATLANASANASAIAAAADKAAADAKTAAARAAASEAAAAQAEARAAGCAGAAAAAAEAMAARTRATTDAAQSANAAAYAANAAQAAATAAARVVAAGGDVPNAARFSAAAAVGGDTFGGGGEGERHDAAEGSRGLSLERALSERDPLAYRLLRWLLSA